MKTISIFLLMFFMVFSCKKKQNATENDASVFAEQAVDSITANETKSIKDTFGIEDITQDQISTATVIREEYLKPNAIKVKNAENYTSISDSVLVNHQNPKQVQATKIFPIEKPLEQQQFPKRKNALLGYSYFDSIQFYETTDIRVFVKVDEKSKTKIEEKLREIEKKETNENDTRNKSIVKIIENISVYDSLKIIPIYNNKEFNIRSLKPQKQKINLKDGNYWHWLVTPILKQDFEGVIALPLDSKTGSFNYKNLDDQQIKIKIKITDSIGKTHQQETIQKIKHEKNENKDDTTNVNFWTWLLNLIEKYFIEILTIIIVPLAITIYKIVRKKLSKDKENNEDEKPNT